MIFKNLGHIVIFFSLLHSFCGIHCYSSNYSVRICMFEPFRAFVKKITRNGEKRMMIEPRIIGQDNMMGVEMRGIMKVWWSTL